MEIMSGRKGRTSKALYKRSSRKIPVPFGNIVLLNINIMAIENHHHGHLRHQDPDMVLPVCMRVTGYK